MLLFIYFLLNYCLSTGDIERFNNFFDIFKDKTYIDKLGIDEIKIIILLIGFEFIKYDINLEKRKDESKMKNIYAVLIDENIKLKKFINKFLKEKLKESTENENLTKYVMNLIKENNLEVKEEQTKEILFIFLVVTSLKIRKFLFEKTDEIFMQLIKDEIKEGEIVNKYFSQMVDYAKTINFNDIYVEIKDEFLLRIK